MREFNRLFNFFTVAAVIVMIFSAFTAACVTVINRTNENIFSTQLYENSEKFVSQV